MLKGNDIIVMLNGEAIAATKSDELQVACEGIPISSSTTGNWTDVIAGRKSWALTTGFLIADTPSFFDCIDMAGMYVILRIKHRTGTVWYEGTALCTQFRVTATKGNLLQGSFAFQGKGKLQFTEPDP
jgi:predicted secreted protein